VGTENTGKKRRIERGIGAASDARDKIVSRRILLRVGSRG